MARALLAVMVCVGLAIGYRFWATQSSRDEGSLLPALQAESSTAKVQANALQGSNRNDWPYKLPSAHLPNAMQVHAKVISGGLPAGEAAFAELQELGIKTIISVDGAKPDLETSRNFGLRYVHLPHGYNGITDQRVLELAKAVRDLEGPIYIHCHHGKHRSPTAAAVACVAVGLLPQTAAVQVLKVGGTSEGYLGLFAAARTAHRLDDAVLDRLQVHFPEHAELPPMAERMVAIEHTLDQLKDFANNGAIESRAIAARHEALLMLEHYTEILRMPEVATGDRDYRERFEKSRLLAEQLEAALGKLASDLKDAVTGEHLQAANAQATRGQATNAQAASGLLKRLTEACAECHRRYRDKPLSATVGEATR